MKILCIDTSGKTCSCALCEDEEVVAERTLDEGLTHSETLMPVIDGLFEASKMSVRQIDLIAAVVGPGSFTGIRIGVCAAKGFAQTLNVPIAGIDALELLSQNAAGFDGLVVPMIDARHGNVYTAMFENGSRASQDALLPFDEAVRLAGKKRTVFLGDGAAALRDKILEIKPDALFSEENFPFAKNAAEIALKAVKTDAFGLYPNYLRESQAERKKNER